MSEDSARPFLHIQTINMDCGNARAMADFYGRFLGWEVTYDDGDFLLMRDPAGGTGLSFQERPEYAPPTWPEQPGQQEKMIHLDIRVSDLEAATAHAIECGARLASFQGRADLRVMLDPASHPFCLFTI